ncbi:hypothetical protein D3C72_2588150 [compost metagenome]
MVGDPLVEDSLLHVTINQSTYDEFVEKIMGVLISEFMDFKRQWPTHPGAK